VDRDRQNCDDLLPRVDSKWLRRSRHSSFCQPVLDRRHQRREDDERRAPPPRVRDPLRLPRDIDGDDEAERAPRSRA